MGGWRLARVKERNLKFGEMIGGILSSFLLELLIYPAAYEVWKVAIELGRQWKAETAEEETPGVLALRRGAAGNCRLSFRGPGPSRNTAPAAAPDFSSRVPHWS